MENNKRKLDETDITCVPEEEQSVKKRCRNTFLASYLHLKDSQRQSSVGTLILGYLSKDVLDSVYKLDEEDVKSILSETSVHDKIRLLSEELTKTFQKNPRDELIWATKAWLKIAETDIPLEQVKNGRDTNNITDFIESTVMFIVSNISRFAGGEVETLIHEWLQFKNEYGVSLMDLAPHFLSIVLEKPLEDITPEFIKNLITEKVQMVSATVSLVRKVDTSGDAPVDQDTSGNQDTSVEPLNS